MRLSDCGWSRGWNIMDFNCWLDCRINNVCGKFYSDGRCY